MSLRKAAGMLCGLLTLVVSAQGIAVGSTKPMAPRQVITLDGTWQVEQGTMDRVPQSFAHTVVVPGLLDMAQPAFQQVGKKSPEREAFWYRRAFKVDGPVPAIAVLKIHKARYGTKVFLNGSLVGEHLPCFTPTYMDLKKFLKGEGQENELVIRVGADRESLPKDMPTGWDFEKYLYIPGIYDSVELTLTGEPYIRNVQLVPDIETHKIRILAEIETSQPQAVDLYAQVAAARTGAFRSSLAMVKLEPTQARQQKVSMSVWIDSCRLWSPEDPYLYEVQLRAVGEKKGTGTSGAPSVSLFSSDAVKIRFGMRTFGFKAGDKRAYVNGKPFYMRGTNVCIYRFFEDANRRDLPWRSDWVRRLHQQFKSMHWDAIRYCIGFPPEMWYDIADEEGFLIQDEFPIWTLNKGPESLTAAKIIPEYTEWMRERWNHPCVVIWDAQNESHTAETGKARDAVRKLDLSNRPWENGWAEPGAATDCVESHPYLFNRGWQGKNFFHLSDMPKVSGVPSLQPAQKKIKVPIIINEYDWLWLNRDGTPTCLTTKIYENLLGPSATADQRRLLRARLVAALTEFWRCHRECAGVLHFCGLGYARAGDKPRPEGGATSDDFIDLEKLTFEPNFAQYVREAFNPVGLMLDFWAAEVPCGSKQEFKVYVINDLPKDWSGTVGLCIMNERGSTHFQSRPCTVVALGREILNITAPMPSEPGDYTIVAYLAEGTGEVIVADLLHGSGKTIRSLRDFKATK